MYSFDHIVTVTIQFVIITYSKITVKVNLLDRGYLPRYNL